MHMPAHFHFPIRKHIHISNFIIIIIVTVITGTKPITYIITKRMMDILFIRSI